MAPFASFRCSAAIRSLSERSGHRPARCQHRIYEYTLDEPRDMGIRFGNQPRSRLSPCGSALGVPAARSPSDLARKLVRHLVRLVLEFSCRRYGRDADGPIMFGKRVLLRLAIRFSRSCILHYTAILHCTAPWVPELHMNQLCPSAPVRLTTVLFAMKERKLIRFGTVLR